MQSYLILPLALPGELKLWLTIIKECDRYPEVSRVQTDKRAVEGQVRRWCWVTFSDWCPANLEKRRARAYCACIRCCWGLFEYLFFHLSSLSFLPLSRRSCYRLMDGWMTCDFMYFSTVFQSYQDDGRLIMNGCVSVQWNSIYG